MESDNQKLKVSGVGIVILIFGIIWFVAGLAAFITSLVCFGRSGETSDKVIGLLLAIFLGPLAPFYFVYLGFNKRYCRKI